MTQSSVPPPTADVWEALRLTNNYRARTGATPLCINPELTRAATRHATDMANKQFLSHVGSDKSTMSDRVSATGYAWRAAAENVLFYSGNLDVPKAINLWAGSPGHARNLANAEYRHVGMARAQGLCPGAKADGLRCWYWAQVFGRSFKTQSCWQLVSRPPTATTTVRPRNAPTRLGSDLGIFEQPAEPTETFNRLPLVAAAAVHEQPSAPTSNEVTPSVPNNAFPVSSLTLLAGVLIAGTVIAVGAMFMVIRESVRMQIAEAEGDNGKQVHEDEEELVS